MRVVAIVNQKGGCGKTTTAVNLAALLAREGVRTLLVDMDPQSHCAAGLGVPDTGLERTIADAMLADHANPPRAEEHLWEVARNLMLAPSSVALAALEAPNGPLAARFDRDRRLARVLAGWRDDFDWCIVDCPPTIGLLSFNALRAADFVLIPVETGFFSLKGAEKQVELMRAMSARFGREIPFRILPTMVKDSRALSRDVVAALAKRFPDSLLPFAIREHDELRDAASYGQAITEFAPGTEAEADFAALAAWIRTQTASTGVLEEYAVFAPPLIETYTADTAFAQGDAAPQPFEAPATTAAPQTGRAQDLVSRLRALADRSRQSAALGGGFGVRAARDGRVVFSQPPSAQALFVTGDFNGWNPCATPLCASADGTRMEASVALAPGRHAYRIVVDGVHALDAFNAHRQSTEDGLGVNLVEVPALGGSDGPPAPTFENSSLSAVDAGGGVA
jgi:chromosome partitioning protein